MEHDEFNDINSAITYSSALISNSSFKSGLDIAEKALNMAVYEGKLINYAASCYVRHAIRTGDVRSVNSALIALISSLSKPRTADSVLELEWLPKAEMLAADPDLIETLKPMYKPPKDRDVRR